MTKIDLTNFAYTFWAGAGISVLYVLIPAAINRFRATRFQPPFWFYMAVLFTVVGGTGYRIWWVVARYLRNTGRDYQWMVHHPFVSLVGALVSIGLLMHVFNISQKERWRATILAIIFSTVLAVVVTWALK